MLPPSVWTSSGRTGNGSNDRTTTTDAGLVISNPLEAAARNTTSEAGQPPSYLVPVPEVLEHSEVGGASMISKAVRNCGVGERHGKGHGLIPGRGNPATTGLVCPVAASGGW